MGYNLITRVSDNSFRLSSNQRNQLNLVRRLSHTDERILRHGFANQ